VATKLEIRRELEWRACKKSLLYFVSEYWHVATIGVGYDVMSPWDYQVKELNKFQSVHDDCVAILDNPELTREEKDRQLRLKARQLGWTTMIGAGVTWCAFFHPYHSWIVSAQGEDDAAKTLESKIKVPFNRLPMWIHTRGPQVIKDNNEELTFDNGSDIMVIPSTSAAGRGQAVFGVVLDESAFAENAEDVFAALDPMCYGPMWVFSSANGMGNWFHETWVESQHPDSEWEGSFYPWSKRPGRDQDWYDRTKRKYRTRPHLFYQEYPSTPEEAFTKSGRVAFPMDMLRDEQHWCPPDRRFDLLRIKGNWQNIDKHGFEPLMNAAELNGEQWADMELHVWQEPYLERDEHGILVRDPNFVVGVDVAEGLEHGDYSTISVMDANTGEQVATVRAHIPVEDLAEYVEFIGYWYWVGLVAVERNNHGILPLSQLRERAYPRLYRMDSLAQQKRGDRTVRYGWWTSNATKPYMVNRFVNELPGLILHDQRLLAEAGVFLSNGKGGYGATPPNHDDLVIATLISVAVSDEVGAYPPAFVDPTPGPATMGDVFALGVERAKERETGAWHGMALAGGIGQAESPQVEKVRKSFEVVG